MDLNEVVAQTIHKPVIKKLKRRKLYSRFKDNIYAADLTEMGSLSSTNRGVNYLLCDHIWVKDVFTKHASDNDIAGGSLFLVWFFEDF